MNTLYRRKDNSEYYFEGSANWYFGKESSFWSTPGNFISICNKVKKVFRNSLPYVVSRSSSITEIDLRNSTSINCFVETRRGLSRPTGVALIRSDRPARDKYFVYLFKGSTNCVYLEIEFVTSSTALRHDTQYRRFTSNCSGCIN